MASEDLEDRDPLDDDMAGDDEYCPACGDALDLCLCDEDDDPLFDEGGESG